MKKTLLTALTFIMLISCANERSSGSFGKHKPPPHIVTTTVTDTIVYISKDDNMSIQVKQRVSSKKDGKLVITFAKDYPVKDKSMLKQREQYIKQFIKSEKRW